jgi:hypothetical protein
VLLKGIFGGAPKVKYCLIRPGVVAVTALSNKECSSHNHNMYTTFLFLFSEKQDIAKSYTSRIEYLFSSINSFYFFLHTHSAF